MKQVFEVSFVCLGNICRSPLAHGVFETLLAREGLDNVILSSSAGTSHWHVGQMADPRMRETAKRKGIVLKNRARQFQPKDFNQFDLVLAMDQSNFSRLEEMAPGKVPDHQLKLFRSFDPESNGEMDVPDPYYGGERGFENIFQIIERTCPKILEFIKSRFPIPK
ncbi:MAG: low molecular weight protein-tyrosine-phosphatase [Nitrospinaceae bacterium]